MALKCPADPKYTGKPMDYRWGGSDNLLPLLIGSAAAGAAAPFDTEVKDYFSSVRRFEELGEVGDFLGDSITIGVASAGLLTAAYVGENQRFRSMSFALSQGFVINFAFTNFLKLASSRQRPNGESDSSFPSGHTSGAFMAATVISHYCPKAWLPAYVTAGLIGVSRLKKKGHFLSDVVAGAALGYIVDRTVVGGTEGRHGKTRIVWAPVSSSGFHSLALVIRF